MTSQTSTATSLQFLGATDTVTGSRFLLRNGNHSILVDAGLYQGRKELRVRNWDAPPFSSRELGAVVLTHAHLDHCGYLPRLFGAGFRGPIFATAGTIALANIVLPDAGRLQEEDARHANEKQWSKHRPALPLFTEDDAIEVAKQFREVPFDCRTELPGGFSVEFHFAGHILGAASIVITEPSGRRVGFSGDVGRRTHPILVAPAPRAESDVLLIESTYGDRQHSEDGPDALGAIVRTTVHRGGTMVIPAFAVDRTELLLHAFQGLENRGAIPAVPIIVDSPMALAVLAVYRQALHDHSPEIRRELFDAPDPFTTPNLEEAHSVEESKEAVRRSDARIVISASGMAAGGRVLHHLVKHLPDPNSTILLAGYQAEGTRGRALLEGASELKIHGRYIPVRAQICAIDSFSSHADADGLLQWAETAPPPATAFIVHGEPSASLALRGRLAARSWNAVVPRYFEQVLI
jgi:metallo-beta-lactamase family protein